MSSYTLKSRENLKSNRLQKPTTTTTSSSSSVPRRTICLGTKTVSTMATAQNEVPQPRRSVPTTSISKTPDLLRPPKFGGQQLANRKPDITTNLPIRMIKKPSVPDVKEKSK